MHLFPFRRRTRRSRRAVRLFANRWTLSALGLAAATWIGVRAFRHED